MLLGVMDAFVAMCGVVCVTGALMCIVFKKKLNASTGPSEFFFRMRRDFRASDVLTGPPVFLLGGKKKLIHSMFRLGS